MWGMGGWTGSDDAASVRALDRAVDLGCNFFDTAWAYGEGRSEQLLGALLRRHSDRTLYVATKVPPANRQWPGRASTPADDVFSYEHIVEYTAASLRNLGVPAIDVLQLHVWDDSWTVADGWKRAVEDLKRQGTIRTFGISVNRWEPANVLRAIETGLVDAPPSPECDGRLTWRRTCDAATGVRWTWKPSTRFACTGGTGFPTGGPEASARSARGFNE